MRRRRYMQGSGEPPAIYNETGAEFYYRQTSGGAIMDNSPLVGRFDKIKGNTIAWNQYAKAANSSSEVYGITRTNVNESTLHIFGTSTNSTNFTASSTFAIIQNHKYYIAFDKVPLGCRIGFSGTTTGQKSIIYTASGSGQYNFGIHIPSGTVVDNDVRPNAFDLTLIYGAGNEPSTVAQFEADYFKWFGKPLTYEPYDEGSLRSVKMSGIKSVGFNLLNLNRKAKSVNWTHGDAHQFSENEYYVGFAVSDYFIPSKINSYSVSTSSVEVNCNQLGYGLGFPIRCLPNTNYYFDSSNSGKTFFAAFYDNNGKYISNNQSQAILTTPTNCYWLVVGFRGAENADSVFDNPIVNLSSTNKNGTYEKYWSETRNIPITTLTGKVNGQGESVVVFPNGMLSAGDVHDEIYKQGGKTYAVKRVGRVDLGSLNWGNSLGLSNQTRQCFETVQLRNYYKIPPNLYIAPNFLCPKFIAVTQAKTWTAGDISNTSSGYVVCVTTPSQYADGNAFASAMQGVYLNYELATPIIYELDSFTLPVSYNCAALGTEEILPENTSTLTSVAPIVDTTYRVGHVAEKPWYGIKWSEDNGQMQRIASNMELHATLPIQSKMKRCMLLDNGSVYKYISDADPFLYEDGTSVKYDGTDGQVMVEVPAYWYTAYKETDENNITWNYLKLYPKGGGQMYSRKIYRGAFEMITDNSDNSAAKGCSVSMLDFASMGTTKDTTSFVASAMKYLSAATSYRNWNYGVVDATNVKNSLGKPTTGRNRATFRSIAARRGAGFSQEYWDSYNSLIRLYVVEYCNFDIQTAINDSLTIEGFKQGGLGAGVTNAESAKWYNFNDYNPFVPCGVTVPLGNKSGTISYAFTNYDFHNVNITYSVPSYRGIENPFGHIFKFIDGFNRKGKVENDVTTEMIYVCDIVNKFAEDNADGYVLQSDTAPRATGSFGGVDWSAKGTFWPKLGGRTMYGDYFYNAYANNTWYTLLGGGLAYDGSYAGLFYLRASAGSGIAYAYLGSRLLFTK